MEKPQIDGASLREQDSNPLDSTGFRRRSAPPQPATLRLICRTTDMLYLRDNEAVTILCQPLSSIGVHASLLRLASEHLQYKLIASDSRAS